MESHDGKQLGGWRGILSASVIVLLALPLVWLAFLCVAHRPLPNWLVNSSIPRSLASRYGVSYSLGSLRVGCFPLAVEARDAEIAFDLPEPVQLKLERLEWTNGGPLRIQALKAGTQDQPELLAVRLADVALESGEIQTEGITVGDGSGSGSATVETLAVSLRAGTSLVRRVQVPAAPQPDILRISIEEISTNPPQGREPETEGWFHLGLIAVSQVEVQVPRAEPSEATTSLCERIREPLSAASEVASRVRASEDAIRDVIARARRDLLLAIIALAVLLFGLKVLVTLWFREQTEAVTWLRHWLPRLLLRAMAILVPFAVFLLLARTLSLRSLLVVAAGASLSLAAVLWWALYRRAANWYQRWEPAAVDAAGFVIVPFLALHGLEITLPSPPAGLRLERITIAGTSVQIEAERCEDTYQIRIHNPETIVAGVSLPFPNGSQGPANITVASIDIPSQSLTVSSADRDLLTVSALAASVSNIHAAVDLETQRISDIGAAIELRGAVESTALRQDLRRVRFLREQAGRLTSARFIAAVDIEDESKPPLDAIDITDLDERQTWLLAQGSVSLDPSQCTFQYETNVRLLADAAKVSIDAGGRSGDDAIRVGSIHSLDGSRIKVTSGSGTVALNDASVSRLRLRGIETAVRQWQAVVDSLGLQAALSTSCSSAGNQSVTATFERTKLQGTNGYAVGIPKADAAVCRSGGARPHISLATKGEQITITGVPVNAGGDGQPWLSADIPQAEFRAAGRTSSEFIPRKFEGEAQFLVSRPALQAGGVSDVAVGTDAPIRFSTDLWEGLIDVPRQARVFRQTVIPRLPAEIDTEISLHGDIGGQLDGSLRIPRFVVEASPVEIFLSDLDIQGKLAWIDGHAQPSVTFRSGWNRARLPELPRSFRLDQIVQLNLETKGSIQRLPWEEDISFGVLPPSCPRFPAPRLNPFRIEGAWPSDPIAPLLIIQGEGANQPAQEIKVWLGSVDDPELRLTYGADTGIRIGRVETTCRRLILPAARLESADVQLNVEAVRTLDRRGDLRASSGVVLGDDQSRFSLQLGQTPAADPLLGVNARLRTGSIDFNSTGEVLLRRLTPALDPFIEHFGCSLGGITLSAGIPQFAGKANFTAEQLSSFDLGFSIAAGPLATIRAGAGAVTTSEGHAPLLRTIELAAGAEASAEIRIERSSQTQPPYGTLRIAATAPSLTAEVTDREGNRHQASANVKTDIAGSLYAEPAAPSSPILERLSVVTRDLVAQARKARNVFGDVAPAMSDTSLNLDWDVSLANDTTGEPVVNLANDDQVRLALRADVKDLAWRIGEQERSRLSASSRLGVASQMHNGHLVVEGEVSGPLEFSGVGLPEERFELSLPFAIAFRDQLQRAPGSEAAWLWDQNYYEDFWRNYPSAYEQLSPQPVLNLHQFTAGPLSLKQLLFPLGALRLAVGHASNLQLHFPFEGRALFGDAVGVLQTDIGWAGEQASVTARGGLSLTDFQAGALGLASHGGHVPFVEDELSGHVIFRADHFLVDRNIISDALSGSSATQGFEGLDLDLRLSRSRRHPETPGVFQLTTQTELVTLNKLLGQISGDIRLSGQLASMLYRGLDFRFSVQNGQILTEPLLLDLRGAELFSSTKLEVGADLRVHWQKEGRPGPVYNLGDAVRWLRSLSGPPRSE